MKNERNFWDVCKQTFSSFRDDNASRSAAALAYYMIFSIVPMLLIVIAAAGMVLGERAAEAKILGRLSGVVGTAAASAIQEMVKRAAELKAGIIATIVGGVTFLFGVAGVFVELEGALNAIWKKAGRRRDDPPDLVAKRVFSISKVFAVGFLVLVSLLLDGGLTEIGEYAGIRLLGGRLLWKALQLMISVAFATAMFAVIFRLLPDAKVKWRDVAIGAVGTAFLFVLGKFALGLYLGTAAVGSSFGAAGSIIVVLVWIYWSATIFLFGLEFTHVYATEPVLRSASDI